MNKITPMLLAVCTLVSLSHAQNISQKGTDLDGEAAGDESGWSVSMPDDNTVAIGAYLNDGSGTNAGHVRIYTWNGSTWTQKGTDIEGEAANDRSGWSVSMPDANTVAIGARYNDASGSDAGHTRVYAAGNKVGMLENSFGNPLTVYPNPTSGEIHLDLGRTYTEATIIVTNPVGQAVLKKGYQDSDVLQLTLPGEAGLYLIEVRSGDKKALLKVMKE